MGLGGGDDADDDVGDGGVGGGEASGASSQRGVGRATTTFSQGRNKANISCQSSPTGSHHDAAHMRANGGSFCAHGQRLRVPGPPGLRCDRRAARAGPAACGP